MVNGNEDTLKKKSGSVVAEETDFSNFCRENLREFEVVRQMA
jgi:hypothetical protein